MGIVAEEETAVEVASANHVGDIMIKAEDISGTYVTVVQLDNGLAQVHFSCCLQLHLMSGLL